MIDIQGTWEDISDLITPPHLLIGVTLQSASPKPLVIYANRNWDTTPELFRQFRENRNGVPVRIIASHIKPGHAMESAADEFYQEPPEWFAKGDPSDEELRENSALRKNYVDFLLYVCKKEGVDVFMARAGQEAIAERINEFHAIGVQVTIMEPEQIRLLNDKAATYAKSQELGLAATVPPWHLLRSPEDLTEARLALQDESTLITKPSVGQGAVGFQIHPVKKLKERPDDFYESRIESFSSLRERIANGCEDLLIMPFLNGPEVSADFLANHGKLILAFPRVKSDTVGRLLSDDPRYLRFITSWVEKLDLDGWGNCQLRIYENPRLRRSTNVLLEFNTRLGAGAHESYLSGVSLGWEGIRQAALRLIDNGKTLETAELLQKGGEPTQPKLGFTYVVDRNTHQCQIVNQDPATRVFNDTALA